jgi:hypothetical protein
MFHRQILPEGLMWEASRQTTCSHTREAHIESTRNTMLEVDGGSVVIFMIFMAAVLLVTRDED